MGNVLKSHYNLHGITYRVKIMLKGIAIVKHWIYIWSKQRLEDQCKQQWQDVISQLIVFCISF